MLSDLRRPHAFAAERVGFCRARLGNERGDPTLVLLTDFWGVPDACYVDDPESGARINSEAIRTAMQTVLDTGEGSFHVHYHDHDGQPSFSWMDRKEQPRLVETFRHTDKSLPHGMLVLSGDSAAAEAWLPDESKLRAVDEVSFVGWPTILSGRGTHAGLLSRFSRQGFLGPSAEQILAAARVCLIGLGGGGSHIAQQLAHLGILNFVLIDPDVIDDSNQNRLVGGSEWDVRAGVGKVNIGERSIQTVRRAATVKTVKRRWQEALSEVRSSDLVFGSLDGFDERRQLEATCRRYLIPYIDIGMDVHTVGNEPPRMAGQVIASMPGFPCMQCLGFINERSLAREAQRYGDAGPRPQVVWSNGLLASSAVGIGVDLLTNWARRDPAAIYLSYDGNLGTLTPHPRLPFASRKCSHYSLADIGDPRL